MNNEARTQRYGPDGLLPAPPCRFLLPFILSWCNLTNYANSLQPFCRLYFVQLVCVCVCVCFPPVSQSDLWPPALQRLGPHGAILPGWVTRGSDVLSSTAPPPSASSLHGDASAGAPACTLWSRSSRPTLARHLFADGPVWTRRRQL